ncbi:MAG TPA: cytochrome P450, partial [Bdellovibrionota bacterium]|nr:cytochrome P450 [Bdellovibrionota bacterium]
ATRWERAGRAGEPVDVAADMMRLTLEVVAACLFGAGIGEEDSRLVGLRLTEAVEAIFKQTFGPPFLAKLPTPSHRRLARAVRDLDRVVVGLIQARRAQLEAGAEVRHDLLDTLISATDPDTGRGLSETQLRDEAMTLFLAGHETTASHLAWTFHLLGTRPEEQEKLGSEARGVIGEKAVAMEDLARLEFCRRVLDESLRLYPPAWWISRTPQVDDEVAGFGIKKGSVVVMSPYVVHRHPAFWDDPERFDPDRFLPQRVQARPKLAYVPFGAGPRFCIGNVFAQVESQIVLSTLMSRFRVEPVEGNVVRRSPQVTLRPSGGPVMRITLR